MAALESAGIHTDSGLNYCRGDQAFYVQLLEKFAEDAPQKAETLEQLYLEKDHGNYRIQAHSLKSSARMIGADALSQTAKGMEDAARESDAAYLESHHRELLSQYLKTVEQIKDALGGQGREEDAQPAGDSQSQSQEADGAELAASLRELKGYLDTYEAAMAQKVLEKLEGLRYGEIPLGELVRDIARDVDNFEFDQAAGKASALIGRVEGGEEE